jgi:hypothetical protein
MGDIVLEAYGMENVEQHDIGQLQLPETPPRRRTFGYVDHGVQHIGDIRMQPPLLQEKPPTEQDEVFSLEARRPFS